MRAITLWQPWASLVAWGAKRFETRSWEPPRDLPGGLLAIHAGGRCVFGDDESPDLKDIVSREKSRHGVMPTGCVVAVCAVSAWYRTERMRDCQQWIGMTDRERAEEWAVGNFRFNRFAWELRDVLAIPGPVPCRGRQRIWTLPDDVEHQVREQVERAGVAA